DVYSENLVDEDFLWWKAVERRLTKEYSPEPTNRSKLM
ncbi:hypothetical protein AALP_AAs40049U000100, partial [Arabis alpina]